MMREWLDRGVDGFRMDVINVISKVVSPTVGADGQVTLPDGVVGEARPALARCRRHRYIRRHAGVRAEWTTRP